MIYFQIGQIFSSHHTYLSNIWRISQISRYVLKLLLSFELVCDFLSVCSKGVCCLTKVVCINNLNLHS